MENIKLGKYYHYKHPDRFYEVIGVAKHSETLEDLVVYRALYESEDFGKDAMWARPVAMFFGTVNIDGKEIPRFTFIE